MAAERPIQPPSPFPETAPYWQAAAEGKLLLKRCAACGAYHFYPRVLCPFCFSATEWRAAAGTGIIYSFSVMRRAAIPYAIAYVTLAEGPTMMTNIVDCDLDAIRIGQKVRVVFKPAENGQAVPMFTPA
ncbi:MAG TPA: Zn-ribbon domain-containing OB-fold protein [Stellaceae bacterium]|nr:Zn-ribbon domain-containing OB-fold protein [Stellaceae bacterium]